MGGTHTLTDSKIRAAKPRAKPYKLAGGAGLFLLVNPDGSKYWRMKYRMLAPTKPDFSVARFA